MVRKHRLYLEEDLTRQETYLVRTAALSQMNLLMPNSEMILRCKGNVCYLLSDHRVTLC